MTVTRSEQNKINSIVSTISGLQLIIKTRQQEKYLRRLKATMAFSLKPYDVDLDLSTKDDRKLFLDGCAGIKDKFDGSKENSHRSQNL